MKWIGQHIYDYISRFRNDVYLEDVSTGTIASGGNLGLDSSNKIVKQSDTGITDLHGAGVDGGNLSVLTDAGDGTITSNLYLKFSNDAGETDTSLLSISSNQDIGDKFTIGTTTHGATTITTIDDDAEAAHLTHIIDGDIKYRPRTGSTYFYKGTNLDDYLKLDIGTHGDAKFTTVDAAATVAHFEIEADGNITLDAASSILFESDIIKATSATSGSPVLQLQSTHTSATNSAELQFLKDAADTEDGENLGLITFYGENESDQNTKFAHIKGSIEESSDGQEGGSIKLAVATHDGEIRNGLIINDGNAEDEIDVTIGDTATSLTTIAGTLTMGSTATINNSGVIQVAAQTVIDHDQLANFAANEHFTQANITTVGTIGTGVWQGTAIASAYLDSDTAHLSTSKQFTYHMMVDDIDTTKIYIPLQTPDTETSVATNKQLRILTPVAGKLLKIFLRANTDLSSNTLTWTLETRNTSSATSGTPTVVGTQSGAGCTNKTMTTYDFTSSLDSGDNIIDAGDTVQIAVQSDSTTANSQYYITCLWEWNLG